MDQTLKTSLIKKAKALAIFTIVYNLIEGIISVYFGIEENSVSLAGFGVDSFIEVFSAMIVFWKISGHETSANKEKIALRGIGLLFMVLAVTTFGSAIYQLISGKHPDTTIPGILVSTISLSFMFWLWRAKKKVGEALNDAVILGDAACSLACIQLSVVLFAGSIAYWIFPNLWWADGVAAVTLTYFIAKEGIGYLKADPGEDHCCC
ncbi:MAG: cation transporter [Bdellovibrionales bacterium]|nr:cation transporter [Bdellovibrionales bacterium]